MYQCTASAYGSKNFSYKINNGEWINYSWSSAKGGGGTKAGIPGTIYTTSYRSWLNLQNGDYISFFSSDSTGNSGYWQNGYWLTNNSSLKAVKFETSGKGTLQVYGNLKSFTNYELPTDIEDGYEQDEYIFTEYCYIFAGCTQLIDASKLLIPSWSCAGLFNGCTNLFSINVNFETQAALYNYNWVYGVAVNGTFICPTALGTNSTITRGNSYCPTGWTVINK